MVEFGHRRMRVGVGKLSRSHEVWDEMEGLSKEESS